jgi:hypothetical protein
MKATDIAQATGDDEILIAVYWPLIVDGLIAFGINTHMTRVAVAATVATECDFRYLTELADGSAYEGRQDLGNTQPGDGARYKGRGFVQTTGRSEYDETGKAIGVDLLNHPELAADPRIAGLSLAYYFKSHGIPAMAEAGDTRAVRRTVNGGYNGWDRFISCWDNLLTIPDAATKTVITVGIAAALRQIPSANGRVAIGPDKKPVQLQVGQVVHFAPDPHAKDPAKAETTPHWAHITVEGSPAHGWYRRDFLVRTDS